MDGRTQARVGADTVGGRPTWARRPALAGRPLVAAVGVGAGAGPMSCSTRTWWPPPGWIVVGAVYI
jgi:hypothetical protein